MNALSSIADALATPLARQFAPRLVSWQRQHGRHDLPWQGTNDPYRVWLSEIMLQQTQVTTVIPYYRRFLQAFPDVGALAAAAQDDVMALWSGLGYYSRARNLHRCAQAVVAEHGGQFPRDVQALATLPGIGRSTAAAIAAFSFGARAAILDGNVKRVLTRVFGIDGYPGQTQVERGLWQLAEALLPDAASGEPAAPMPAYTQGLMDLGATVCVRGRPACAACPFERDCVAHASGRERALPVPKPRKAVPQRYCDVLVVRHGARVLFERRPDSGVWGGLWSLPELAPPAAVPGPDDGDARAGEIARAARMHGEVTEVARMAPLTHTFTHFRLHLQPWLVTLDAKRAASGGNARHAWLTAHEIAQAGLPAPVRRIAQALSGDGAQMMLSEA